MTASREDIAEFYALAMELCIIDRDAIVRWADREILTAAIPDEKIVNLSISAGRPSEQTIHLLRGISGRTGYSDDAIRLLAGLLARDIEMAGAPRRRRGNCCMT